MEQEVTCEDVNLVPVRYWPGNIKVVCGPAKSKVEVDSSPGLKVEGVKIIDYCIMSF